MKIPNIHCVGGLRSGKTTLSNKIVDIITEKGGSGEVHSLASPIKDIADKVKIHIYSQIQQGLLIRSGGSVKNLFLKNHIRPLLQGAGDALRDYDEDVFINLLISRAKKSIAKKDKIIVVDDCRFINENHGLSKGLNSIPILTHCSIEERVMRHGGSYQFFKETIDHKSEKEWGLIAALFMVWTEKPYRISINKPIFDYCNNHLPSVGKNWTIYVGEDFDKAIHEMLKYIDYYNVQIMSTLKSMYSIGDPGCGSKIN